MGTTYPIKTRTETEDGWRVELDYGPKQGVTVVTVRCPPYDAEEAAKTRRNMNAVLKTMGYRLKEE